MKIWIWIAIFLLAYLLGRLGVRQRGALPMLAFCAINLAAYRAGIRADLEAGRRAFESKHKAEIKALTLTPAEVAAITPRKPTGGKP